ncbi:hypothetical protein [Actinomadura hibisca]|uniref:hypothetical protein n=1 Tax=Actinomadura hibisca TaxID=68565 RepID=UPI0012F83DC0|nr:hypothetical protein [Actinomadura hibisca]
MSTVADSADVGDVEGVKARLRAEFPGWSIIVTNRGRWWATRGPLPPNRMNEVADLEDDTSDGLHAKLVAVTRQ